MCVCVGRRRWWCPSDDKSTRARRVHTFVRTHTHTPATHISQNVANCVGAERLLDGACLSCGTCTRLTYARINACTGKYTDLLYTCGQRFRYFYVQYLETPLRSLRTTLIIAKQSNLPPQLRLQTTITSISGIMSVIITTILCMIINAGFSLYITQVTHVEK